MPATATYDDANLILRLFELRRDDKLRQAREWFAKSCKPTSFDDMQRIAPPGSQENAYVRMVGSYWEMAASFVTSGVLNQELLFQSGGELLFVWERLRPAVTGFRELMKSSQPYHNLETVANQYIRWMESHGPEAYTTFRQMVRNAPGSTEPAPETGKAGA